MFRKFFRSLELFGVAGEINLICSELNTICRSVTVQVLSALTKKIYLEAYKYSEYILPI